MQKVFVYGTLAGRRDQRHQRSRRAPRHRRADICSARPRCAAICSISALIRASCSTRRARRCMAMSMKSTPDLIAVLDEIEEVYPGVEGLFVAREVMVEVDGAAMACRFYPVTKNAVKGLPEIQVGRLGRVSPVAPALRHAVKKRPGRHAPAGPSGRSALRPALLHRAAARQQRAPETSSLSAPSRRSEARSEPRFRFPRTAAASGSR